MSATRYLLFVLVTLVGLSLLAGLNAALEFGRYTRSGYASCAYIERKTALASGLPSPKLVVVSGSNSAAGINVRTLTDALAIRGFNFALVATFAPGFQLFEAKKVLKPGDAVLLPFEYLAYDYGAPTNALVDAVYSCGLDYWRSLDWTERLFFVFALRPQRFFSTLGFDQKTVATVETTLRHTVDSHGDLPLDAPELQARMDVASHQPILVRFLEDSSGVKGIRAFLDWAKANGITVFATWPNTLYFPQYANNPAFGQIRAFYENEGVTVIGRPEDAMFSAAALSDTIYHLNARGIVTRTAKLVDLLRDDPAFVRWSRTPGK